MTKLLHEKQPEENKMSKALEAYRLTDQQKEAIEKSQQSLLNKPVDIVKLAKNLGIAKVVRSDLGEKISGMIEKRKEGFVIITNEAEPKVRRRFTIAYELAHFLLHKDQISDGMRMSTILCNFIFFNVESIIVLNDESVHCRYPIPYRPRPVRSGSFNRQIDNL